MVTTFKELSIDVAEDAAVMGRFWAAVTGGEYVEKAAEDNPGDVVGTEEGMGIAIGLVPEPKTVKHRVHLDVLAESLDEVVALGATPAPDQDPHDAWTVMLDPEGGEFCVFLRNPLRASYRTHELVVDAADPARIAAWWGQVFDVPVSNEGQPWSWLTGVAGMSFEAMVFQPVPEPKTVKNRIHWDVYGDVEDLLARGATLLWEMPRWTTLADPEGNEFCVFAQQS